MSEKRRIACLWSISSRTWPGAALVAQDIGNPFEYLVPLLDGDAQLVMAASDREADDLARLVAFEPDVLLVSSLSAGSVRALRLVAALRSHRPAVRVVWGGWHAAAFPDELLRAGVDTVVIGPGENALASVGDVLDLPRGVVDVRRRPRTWTVPRKLGLGAVVAPGLPPGRVCAGLSAIEGCPRTCRFCAQSGTRYEVRPKRLLEQEVADIAASGARGFFLLDGNPMAHPRAFAELCATIRETARDRLRWRVFGDCSSVDDDVARLFHAAGGRNVYFGVETVDDESAGHYGIGRKLVRRTPRSAAEILRRHGVYVTASAIVGDPVRPVDPAALVRALEEVRPDFLALHQLMPIPGTPMWDELAPLLRTDVGLAELDQTNPDGFFDWSGRERPAETIRWIIRRYFGGDAYASLVSERLRDVGPEYLDDVAGIRAFLKTFDVDPWSRCDTLASARSA